MKNILFPLLVFVFAGYVNAQQNIIDKLVGNINEITLQQKVSDEKLIDEFIHISGKGKFGSTEDVKLYLEVNAPDADVKSLLVKQKADGSWPDIDYNDKERSSWAPKLHAIRLQVLSKVYKSSSSKYYHSPVVSKAIHKAMLYWFNTKPVCPNWWYNDIGIPTYMGPAFLLIKDELTNPEKEQLAIVMDRKVNNATGQNKVWDAGKAIMYALLINDRQLLASARDSIISEIYVTTQEGLQNDYSFHQHGPQMQFGNYGLSYISTMAYWARVFAGTPFAFDSSRIKCLSDYIINGIQWTLWRGFMDPEACGRQVFQNAQRSKSFTLGVAALNMMVADTSLTVKFSRLIKENFANNSTANTLMGHKHFWRSDYTIHRAKGWYASVRMNSARTKGIEMTNQENLQGYYAADGVMSVLVDGDEYNNIFPLWNWRRLPGLTVQDSVKATMDYSLKRSAFTGGLNSGNDGVSATVIQHDGLTAYKSYFFMDDLIVCLGAGISTEKEYSVFTTINQPFLKGNVTCFTANSGKPYILPDDTEMVRNNINAVFHNKIGYYLFTPAKLHISNQKQTGNWSSIAEFYKNVPETGRLFNLFIEHGVMPHNAGYAYCILPNISVNKLNDFSRSPSVNIISNTVKCQAVMNVRQQKLQAVFYQPQWLQTKVCNVYSANAGIIMCEKINNKLKITVEDPTQMLTHYELMLKGKYSGEHTVYLPESNETKVLIALPDKAGYKGMPALVEVELLNE